MRFPSRYNKKMREKIEKPKAFGTFGPREGMALLRGKGGALEEGIFLELHLLVDESDGIVVDARFTLFGPPALIAAAEVTCDLLVGKNMMQIRRLGVSEMEGALQDPGGGAAFVEEDWPSLNLVIDALDELLLAFAELPAAATYIPSFTEGKKETYPGWAELSDVQKKAVLEEVIEKEIRPYIELDEGGIEISSFVGNELVISYQGACTSCYSSVGATLSTIQQILQNKVDPDLHVSVDAKALQLQ